MLIVFAPTPVAGVAPLVVDAPPTTSGVAANAAATGAFAASLLALIELARAQTAKSAGSIVGGSVIRV